MKSPLLGIGVVPACALGAVFAFTAFSICPPARAACATTSVGVDTSKANAWRVAFDGRGYGETFLARDTLVHAITVWRPAEYAIDAIPRQLFVMAVDSTGRPIRYPLLLVGPKLVVLNGDGIHPVKYEFVFDPPFLLPGRGMYFFTIQAECLSAFNLLADTTDSYPDGKAWKTGPVIDCSAPGHLGSFEPMLDLVFEVQFCQTPTEAHRTSWGQLKLKYR